jgi:arginyl-tRNA--protein-N-Asp/Glu arginylyltransferase
VYTAEKHQLWIRYLTQIHGHADNDTLLKESEFRNFFCNAMVADPTPDSNYGTYHLIYRLDGHMVAACLITWLPRYWVSEYVMWGMTVVHPCSHTSSQPMRLWL